MLLVLYCTNRVRSFLIDLCNGPLCKNGLYHGGTTLGMVCPMWHTITSKLAPKLDNTDPKKHRSVGNTVFDLTDGRIEAQTLGTDSDVSITELSVRWIVKTQVYVEINQLLIHVILNIKLLQ